MSGINYAIRRTEEILVSWANSATDSAVINLAEGAYGGLIVESGSNLIGKTFNVCAYSTTTQYATVALLSAAKTIAAGNNYFTAEEIAQLGGVRLAIIRLNSGVTGAQTATLLWKS